MQVPKRILLGPGPSDVDPKVLAAMSQPLVGHLDPFFAQITSECQVMLRQVMGTANEVTFPVSGTGSAGMEACLVNLLERGDRALVAVNGVFGARMVDVAERCGAEVATISAPWGECFDPVTVETALKRVQPKIFAVVHAETSTGAWQDLAPLGALCKQAGALFVVDCVTSLAGVPVQVDDWGIDAAYSGTQKCLSCPPGLSPVTFSPRAMEFIGRRKTKVQSWYLDVSMVKRYWGEERFYHHTAPISMVYALHAALQGVLEEGMPRRWQRHKLHHEALKAGLAALGISYIPQVSLPMLNAIHIPAGMDDVKTRQALLENHGIEIGGGLGDFKGRAWRIGLMGYSCQKAHVLSVLTALEKEMLAQSRARSKPGIAADAAQSFYAKKGDAA